MRTYATVILATVLVSACATRESSSSTNTQPAASTPSPSRGETPPSAAYQRTVGAPVEFTYGGLSADKASISYKVKVNADKPIEEVHLALKETDAQGKVLEQTTIVWQNIVHSTRQPIENGKTYEDTSSVDPASAKVECSLKEVVFKDSTRWSPK